MQSALTGYILREKKVLQARTASDGPTAIVVMYVQLKDLLEEAMRNTPNESTYVQVWEKLNAYGFREISQMLNLYEEEQINEYTDAFDQLKATIDVAISLLV